MPPTFTELDRQKGELQRGHPGWRIWYVPHATGPTIWCAQREPTLNEASPEDLEKAIKETETDWRDDIVRDLWHTKPE
jgi:hypothetical protein